MEDWLKQVKDNWNKTADSDWYKSLRTDAKIEALLNAPAKAFHLTVYALINKYFPDLKGKKILLPSSGDNHAAFAFALLGADVTSADISERQLENAAIIADKWKLDIEFICDNTDIVKTSVLCVFCMAKKHEATGRQNPVASFHFSISSKD